MQGWAGKILDINLTDGRINTLPLDKDMARLFLGGRGLGARLLWDLVGPGVGGQSSGAGAGESAQATRPDPPSGRVADPRGP